MMTPLYVWPVKMYDFRWNEHQRYQVDLKRVCDDLEVKKQTSGVATSIKHGLYESGFDFCSIDDSAVLALSHYLKQCLFQAAADANRGVWRPGMDIQVEIHESWCHVTRDGGYHDMHVHPNSSWSAIYYLDTGDMDVETKNGLNRFYRPYDNMWSDVATSYQSNDNNIDIRAEPGQVIVFPSFIQHSALLYRGAKPRYVVAVNSQFSLADLTNVTVA